MLKEKVVVVVGDKWRSSKIGLRTDPILVFFHDHDIKSSSGLVGFVSDTAEQSCSAPISVLIHLPCARVARAVPSLPDEVLPESCTMVSIPPSLCWKHPVSHVLRQQLPFLEL